MTRVVKDSLLLTICYMQGFC